VGEIISETVGDIISERRAESSRTGGRLRPDSSLGRKSMRLSYQKW
jgi:hypothetical protein